MNIHVCISVYLPPVMHAKRAGTHLSTAPCHGFCAFKKQENEPTSLSLRPISIAVAVETSIVHRHKKRSVNVMISVANVSCIAL